MSTYILAELHESKSVNPALRKLQFIAKSCRNVAVVYSLINLMHDFDSLSFGEMYNELDLEGHIFLSYKVFKHMVRRMVKAGILDRVGANQYVLLLDDDEIEIVRILYGKCVSRGGDKP